MEICQRLTLRSVFLGTEPVCQCVIIFFSARHHSLSIMGIMHSLVCLPQAQVKQPGANNEHSVAVKPEGQGNIS